MYDELSALEIETLLSAATAAPSMHNTQPWRFEINGGVIDVFLDASRALPAEDSTGRAMRIAAGAAVFNLRVAAAHLGVESWYGLMPSVEEPNLIARVVLERSDHPDPALARFYQWITRRHTSRVPPTTADPIPQQCLVDLLSAAADEGTELIWLPDAAIDAFLGLVVDAELRGVVEWRRSAERAHWVGGDRTADGVPSTALGVRSSTYPSPVRDLATAPRDRTRRQARFESHPAVAVLSTEGDTAVDAVTAGLALERVLLTATASGLSASFLNQPLEYDDLRADTQRLTGRPGHAHMVIRFAHGRGTAATPRRPVDELYSRASQKEERR